MRLWIFSLSFQNGKTDKYIVEAGIPEWEEHE